MPFTFSHPALVLPLINKRWKLFSATGLVIGSIIPDFESFIRLNVNKPHSHTWLGMFWFDLPLAVITAFVFHNVVRDALILNLPDFIGGKFARYLGYDWNEAFKRNCIPILISMLIGIFSHLAWDSFTHLNLAYPGINASKTLVFNTTLHALLQDSSSVAGIIISAWYVVRLPNQYDANVAGEGPASGAAETAEKVLYWLLATVATSLILYILLNRYRHPINIILRIDLAISAMLSGLLVASALQKLFKEGNQFVPGRS
jgi:hypothetical protein